MENILPAGDDIIAFWFEEVSPQQWWQPSEVFDQLIEARFAAVHAAAERSELAGWRQTARGRLAEIIVLDQFSRNLYRGQARAFASDALALDLARLAVAAGADRELPVAQRAFLFMPYMHSESAAIHAEAVLLFSVAGLENALAFELRHQAIIERFGRYPHRNAILGRQSTAEEIAFLETPGSSF